MIKQGQLLITFHSHIEKHVKSQIHNQFGRKKIDEIPQLNVEIIEVPIGEEGKYKEQYKQHQDVKFAEFNTIGKFIYSTCKGNSHKCVPNDPLYSDRFETSEGLQKQWGLQRINPEKVFCKVKHIEPITRIAILDSGIDPNHPDLAAKITDPINVSSDNSEDYIDTLGHGTFVAGIAAAITNNSTGIASASYNTAKIIPVKIGGDAGGPDAVTAIKGIMYAIEKKADVINMSFGFPDYTQVLQLALEKAWDAGIISVAAAGNSGNEQPSYPAACNFVLGVSATNKKNRLAAFSTWGLDVGITAPGTAIVSTSPTYPVPALSKTYYDASNGTSFSAPLVSGVAAMLRAIKRSASNQEIIQAIQRSAYSLDTMDKNWSSFYGYGLLNLSAAVSELVNSTFVFNNCRGSFGSFYGQVVDENDSPLVTTVIAVDNKTKEKVRTYEPKLIPIIRDGIISLGIDGMFRLFNLPKGNYSIYYGGIDPNNLLIGSIDVVPGADVYLKLKVKSIV